MFCNDDHHCEKFINRLSLLRIIRKVLIDKIIEYYGDAKDYRCVFHK